MSKNILVGALAAFLIAGVASAEITATVKKGSSKARVMEVQEALNACIDAGLPVTGFFGPLTTAAVKKFQGENGISRVGYVGPATAAALNDCASADDEDEDSSDDSSTDDSSTGSTGSTTLSGPEGTLSNITKLGSYNNTKVTEAEKDIKVYGVELTAKDGDQKIDGFNIAFKNTAAGSAKFTKYASEISVWLDGVEIGRKLASEFSDDAGDTYTYRFSGMAGVVKKDQKVQMIVAVSGVNSMDSTDATSEAWYIDAGASVNGTNTNYISAMSSNGRFRDWGGDFSSSSRIDFQKAGGASSDQKYKVTTSSTSPLAQTVQVSTTADTSDKTLLAFDVKAENGAMIVQKIPVTLVATDGALDGVAPFTNAIVKSIKLYANGTKIADESVPQDGTDSASEVIIFGNSSKLNYKIANNDTVKFEVRVDLNDTESTLLSATDFDNGDKISASYRGDVTTCTDVANSTTADDVACSTVELDNANQDTVSNRSGSAIGQDMTLRSSGLQVTMGSVTTESTTNQTGETLTRTIKVPVTVKAFDETMYLSQAAENATTPTTTQAVAFTFEDAAGATKVITNSVTWTSTDATVESSAYRVDAGSTRNFLLTAVLSGTTAHAQKQYRIQMNKINGYTNAALSTGQALQDLSPTNSFETGYYTLNLN